MSKLLLVLLGGAQWGSASPRGRMQQQCQRTKVAVLGAGTAGIRAAVGGDVLVPPFEDGWA